MKYLNTFDVYITGYQHVAYQNLDEYNEGLRTSLKNLLITAGISISALSPLPHKSIPQQQIDAINSYNKILSTPTSSEYKEFNKQEVEDFKKRFIAEIEKDDTLINKQFIIDSIKNVRIFVVPKLEDTISNRGMLGFFTNIGWIPKENRGTLPENFIVVQRDELEKYDEFEKRLSRKNHNFSSTLLHEISHYIDKLLGGNTYYSYYSNTLKRDFLDFKIVEIDDSGKVTHINKTMIEEKLSFLNSGGDNELEGVLEHDAIKDLTPAQKLKEDRATYFVLPDIDVKYYTDFFSSRYHYYLDPLEQLARFREFKKIISEMGFYYNKELGSWCKKGSNTLLYDRKKNKYVKITTSNMVAQAYSYCSRHRDKKSILGLWIFINLNKYEQVNSLL